MSVALVPTSTDLEAVLTEVWASFIDQTQSPMPAAQGQLHGSCWSATVQVSGAWSGTVTIELPPALADTVAHRMLDIPITQPLNRADLVDAVGELVNILGGNLKSLMPGPSDLSLPTVTMVDLTSTDGSEELSVLIVELDSAALRLQMRPSPEHFNTPKETP